MGCFIYWIIVMLFWHLHKYMHCVVMLWLICSFLLLQSWWRISKCHFSFSKLSSSECLSTWVPIPICKYVLDASYYYFYFILLILQRYFLKLVAFFYGIVCYISLLFNGMLILEKFLEAFSCICHLLFVCLPLLKLLYFYVLIFKHASCRKVCGVSAGKTVGCFQKIEKI